ncbi:MAG: hypothetical protein ACKOA0_15545, partial [Burkholderiaceae bacterium]
MNIDNEISAGSSYLHQFLVGVEIGDFVFGDLKKLHARGFIRCEHCTRKAKRGCDEIATRHTSRLRVSIHFFRDLIAHVPAHEQRGADLIRVEWILGLMLHPFKVVQNVEFHVPDSSVNLVEKARGYFRQGAAMSW